MNEIISEIENGQVFLCPICRLVHFEYKNISFNFTNIQFENFVEYFSEINSDFWEVINANSYFRRKIFIPVGTKNFKIILNKTEVEEIKELLKQATKKIRKKNKFKFPYWRN